MSLEAATSRPWCVAARLQCAFCNESLSVVLAMRDRWSHISSSCGIFDVEDVVRMGGAVLHCWVLVSSFNGVGVISNDRSRLRSSWLVVGDESSRRIFKESKLVAPMVKSVIVLQERLKSNLAQMSSRTIIGALVIT